MPSEGRVGDVAKIISGQHVPSNDVNEHQCGIPYLTGPADFLRSGVLATKYTSRGKSFCEPDDLLITVKGSGVGSTAVADQKYAISRQLMAVRARRGIDQSYLNYSTEFAAGKLVRQARGTIPGLTRQDVAQLPFLRLALPEQRKIAEILRTWDEAIEVLSRRRMKYVELYRATVTTVFESSYRVGQMRPAKEILEPVSERNHPELPLLAVTQDLGVVRRDELERRVVMPEGDVSNYKVVREGDFVISLRSFEGGLEYSRVTGLVSPAYTVLRSTSEIDPDYFRHYFKSYSFIGRLRGLIFGIRDGKQISFRDFGDMLVPYPSPVTQRVQAQMLNSIESVIHVCEKLEQLVAAQKRGLMQKLLTGEWRVKVDDVEAEGA